MISIINQTTNKEVTLQNNRMIVIEGGTWDDYWTLSHEDIKVEFIDEEIFIHSPANLEHEEIFANLLTQFKSIDPPGKVLGSRFPIRLKDGKRAEPDIMYLSPYDISQGNLTKTVFDGEPSFIVEIVSPNYRSHDTETKLVKYQELGVEEYWIIDPEFKEIRVLTFDNYQLIYENLYTEGTLSPKIPDLKKITVQVGNLWSLGIVDTKL